LLQQEEQHQQQRVEQQQDAKEPLVEGQMGVLGVPQEEEKALFS
jgi:hypothetical protein